MVSLGTGPLSVDIGEWSEEIKLPNVPIHLHVLPNRSVLFWGRRSDPDGDLDAHICQPYIWNPELQEPPKPTPQPEGADGVTVNLFCSGHTFLPDGKLLVVGGHWRDSEGITQSCIYDYADNTWTASDTMNEGRWYPTAITLANGDVLVSSGSYLDQDGNLPNNPVQQIWSKGKWSSIVDFKGLPLYPRMHLAPNGQVFMSGALQLAQYLDTNGAGNWQPVDSRSAGVRDYAPSVMYDVGKIMFLGGGNDEANDFTPTNMVELIDLNQVNPQWRQTAPMNFARRQHNATILPDGTVLITGGTRGIAFNDLTKGAPVHEAELFNPATETWKILAPESFDRCYHSTAVLLPDGRVLSAGGGEYRPDLAKSDANDPKDSLRNAQIFSPPYLFKSTPRPQLLPVPSPVEYAQQFDVSCSSSDKISKVSWIRLPSVTHSFDQSQRINFLQFEQVGPTVTITAPKTPELCPPGHYMLFLLSEDGTPSIGQILQILPSTDLTDITRGSIQSLPVPPLNISELSKAMKAQPVGTHVVVGITPSCPYGISACWGGAYEGLSHLSNVSAVAPVPNAQDSTADLFLKNAALPDLNQWRKEFASIVHGVYTLRGAEITLDGVAENIANKLLLRVTFQPDPIELTSLDASTIVQWRSATTNNKPIGAREADAYSALNDFVKINGAQRVVVTGPLTTDSPGKIQIRMVTRS